MTAKDLKFSINQILEQIDDDTVLEAYYEILLKLVKVQQSQVVGYDINGQPMTKEKMEEKIKAAKDRRDGIARR